MVGQCLSLDLIRLILSTYINGWLRIVRRGCGVDTVQNCGSEIVGQWSGENAIALNSDNAERCECNSNC